MILIFVKSKHPDLKGIYHSKDLYIAGVLKYGMHRSTAQLMFLGSVGKM